MPALPHTKPFLASSSRVCPSRNALRVNSGQHEPLSQGAATGKLRKIPTSDGLALVSYTALKVLGFIRIKKDTVLYTSF
jgi:hypothetical protein